MKRIIILLLILSLGTVSIAGLSLNPDFFSLPQAEQAVNTDLTVAEEQPDESADFTVIFSHDETFYEEKIEVELTSTDPDAKIYYTLNGNIPNEEAKLYDKPISISSTSTVKALTVKAVAVKDGENSEIITKSYIIGKDVFERFSPETYIFLLSSDMYNLYDYYYGIAVEGYLRDEYKNSPEYKGGNIDPPAPANYNMRGRESERDMYVEVYDNVGNQLINQAAGARVSGGWSRANLQKSWQLFARNEYSEGNGKFKYPFFYDSFNSVGQLIDRFDRITLRNNGNDREQAAIRDELSQRLAKQAGFPDTQSAVPAAVFLNSMYYGFSWLKQSYCNGYLESMYGGIKDNYQIIQKSENAEEGAGFAVANYQYVYNLALQALNNDGKDFTDDNRFNEFCSLIDIDNLILYYAIQVYIDNKDWPGNNIKLWRYYASDDEIITNPYNDGKWRFLMFDVEFAWSLYGNHERYYKDDTLANILGMGDDHMGGTSVLLQAVLQREDMREKFSNTLCDLISGAFSPENANKVLNELIQESNSEFSYALNNGFISFWSYEDWFQSNRNQIRDFANNRPVIIYKSLRNVFDIPQSTEMYDVTLTNCEGADTFLNTQKLSKSGEQANGVYFDCFETEIRAIPYSGYEFECWEINGQPYYEPVMKINSEMVDGNKKINIVLKVKKLIDGVPLYISELYSGSGGDWAEIYNPNSIPVSTANYYLSDDITNLKKWKIPTMNIPAQGSLMITMKNNKSSDSLLKPQANFSLKSGEETLYLSDINGEIIGFADVLNLKSGQTMKRDDNGNYYIYE